MNRIYNYNCCIELWMNINKYECVLKPKQMNTENKKKRNRWMREEVEKIALEIWVHAFSITVKPNILSMNIFSILNCVNVNSNFIYYTSTSICQPMFNYHVNFLKTMTLTKHIEQFIPFQFNSTGLFLHSLSLLLLFYFSV